MNGFSAKENMLFFKKSVFLVWMFCQLSVCCFQKEREIVKTKNCEAITVEKLSGLGIRVLIENATKLRGYFIVCMCRCAGI